MSTDPRVVGTVWLSADGLIAISDLTEALLPGADGAAGPTWHVSVSRRGVASTIIGGSRPSDDDLRRVIDAFEMPGFDEDNHFPGVARHLFCPVDERYRGACECKLTETLITEADGYVWSNDETAGCRGCHYKAVATLAGDPAPPCPLHGGRPDRLTYPMRARSEDSP